MSWMTWFGAISRSWTFNFHSIVDQFVVLVSCLKKFDWKSGILLNCNASESKWSEYSLWAFQWVSLTCRCSTATAIQRNNKRRTKERDCSSTQRAVHGHRFWKKWKLLPQKMRLICSQSIFLNSLQMALAMSQQWRITLMRFDHFFLCPHCTARATRGEKKPS